MNYKQLFFSFAGITYFTISVVMEDLAFSVSFNVLYGTIFRYSIRHQGISSIVDPLKIIVKQLIETIQTINYRIQNQIVLREISMITTVDTLFTLKYNALEDSLSTLEKWYTANSTVNSSQISTETAYSYILSYYQLLQTPGKNN